MISHLSLGTNDLARATAFYDVVLPVLGYKRILTRDDCVAYGADYPAFWVVHPLDESRPAHAPPEVIAAITEAINGAGEAPG